MSDDRKPPHELVIVRSRGGGHDDGHHGGAWKIAFADFMTALMCFFLVMWLINSTDKKTLSQVATYFNPMRLNDKQPSKRGPHDQTPTNPNKQDNESKEGKKSGEKPAGNEATDASAAKTKKSQKGADKEEQEAAVAQLDRDLLRDPYGVLERIAAPPGAPTRPLTPEKAVQGLPRDLFDHRAGDTNPAVSARPQDEQKLTPPSGAAPESKAQDDAVKPGGAEKTADGEKTGEGAKTGDGSISSVKDLESAIKEALADVAPGKRPNVEVSEGENELLISLTDEFDFGMFAVSSARPTRELVVVVDRVAKVVARTKGAITIRGHTDARQFRTDSNDNWRLSMSRAQIAFYMLRRGGLDDKRVRRLEGDADRVLKVASDPMAPQNRRIEILIAKDGK